MQIDFQDTEDLLKPLQWVKDPDPQVQQGSAERYTLLEQISEERGLLTSWGLRGTCLQRFVACQGRIGTSFLLDAEDMVASINNDGFKNVSIRLSQNQTNSVKVQAVSRIVGGRVESNGHVNVQTYPGSIREFPRQEALTITLGTINFSQLAPILLRAHAFSELTGDKCERHVLLRLLEGRFECFSAEHKGANGFAHCYQSAQLENYALDEEFAAAMFARYFKRISEVGRGVIEIRVNDLENPTSIQWIGERGIVTTPLILQEYQLRYLQKGVFAVLGHPTVGTTEVASRVFDAERLSKCLAIQAPRKTATRFDIRMEATGSDIQISKMGDTRRTEYSVIPNDPEYLQLLERSWASVSCGHQYLDLGVKVAIRAMQDAQQRRRQQQEQLQAQATDEDLDFDFEPEDEGDEDFTFRPSNRVLLEVRAIQGQSQSYFLFVKPCSAEDLVVVINAVPGIDRPQEEES